jgi:FixJ family two-component response regulator
MRDNVEAVMRVLDRLATDGLREDALDVPVQRALSTLTTREREVVARFLAELSAATTRER